MTQPSQQRDPRPRADAAGRGCGAPVVGAVLGSLLLSGGALAQDSAPPATTPPAASTPVAPAAGGAEQSAALATLAEQVEYWRAQNRPELAFAAVERLLAASPRDPDVLASAAEIASQLGRKDAADGYLATLRRVAPNDRRIAVVERHQSFGESDRAALEEARALAQSGRAAEAITRYQSLFPNGNVPDNLAPEYYQTMAGIDYQRFRDATAALRQRLERDPDNARMRLTLAQIQTYRETTRYSGIETLRSLTTNSSVAAPARAAWRQALLWEGPSGELISAIETYLASNSSDPQIEAKLREARGTLPDAATQARIDGYQSVEAGQLAQAEQQFRTSLQSVPDDPGALAGLGLVRWRQGHAAEARDLRDRAIAAAPQRRDEFMTMFTGLDAALQPARSGGGGQARIPPSPSVQARQALARGNLEQADDFARRAARSNASEQVQAEVILGLIALRRDDLATAEARFRAALARRPGLTEALGGLYDVLQRQNRFAEAEALQQETGFRPGSSAGLATQRAYSLRDEASRSEPAQAIALLSQAKAVDPQNSWVRLDLVRLLRAQGQEAEAAREEQELVALGNNDAAYAAALLAQDQERYGEVVARLEAIPARVRNADANRLLTQARQEQEIGRLEALARDTPRSDAMQRLMALAARPDPSGTMAAGVVRALGRLQQPEAAAQAARAALAVNRNATPDARIQLAGALLSARRVEDAQAITASLLAEGRLTEEQRRQIASLSAGSAVVQAGQLSAEGNQRAALAQLQPALREMPDNPAVNLALARVYLASNRAPEAQGIADAVLARNPGSLEALTVAADAALARRDWRRADALLQEGRSRFPADPQIMLLEARRARAQGDHYRALRALESAGVRRYAQLQAGGGSRASDAELLATRLRGGTEEAAGQGAEISDPVASQIANELAAARQETVTWLQAGVGVRGRSGQGGLSKLTEVTAPVEVSAAVPGIGGRVTAKAEAVSLNTGSIGSDLNTLRQFGSNVLGGGNAVGLNGAKGTATGVALNVGYAYGDLRADIGSTPLGFRIANVVGGIEYAPSLTDRLRLRITGERRAVSDSLLSYAGLRDSRTGATWGGVTTTGGRAQLEYTVGDAVLYGGGGYAAIDGRHVANNSRFDLGGGIAWTVLRQPDQSLVLGFDARYAAFEKNLRYFTLGHGGYFSPQSQVSAVVQADWRKRIGDLRLRLGGAVGYQTYREDDTAVFPNNPELQAQLAAAAAADSTLAARYAGRDGSGVIGNLRAEAEYDITPQLRIGAYATYDRSGDWKQATGMVRLRYAFEQPGPDLNPMMPLPR
ncbi:cellulose biosynthesis protein BcsC [Pseudoroseomonas ludipueritiae]